MANNQAVSMIEKATNRIVAAKKASAWLEEHGNLDPNPGIGAGGIKLEVLTASGLGGFNEANAYLQGIVRSMWPEIVKQAKAQASAEEANQVEVIRTWSDRL